MGRRYSPLLEKASAESGENTVSSTESVSSHAVSCFFIKIPPASYQKTVHRCGCCWMVRTGTSACPANSDWLDPANAASCYRLKAPLGLSLLRCATQTRSHPKPRRERVRQTGSYHFPLTIRPPTKMEEKIAAKNKRVIQIGLNTHSHDHEINPVTFSTAKIKTKATIGSILDRWDFFSVCITEPP